MPNSMSFDVNFRWRSWKARGKLKLCFSVLIIMLYYASNVILDFPHPMHLRGGEMGVTGLRFSIPLISRELSPLYHNSYWFIAINHEVFSLLWTNLYYNFYEILVLTTDYVTTIWFITMNAMYLYFQQASHHYISNKAGNKNSCA